MAHWLSGTLGPHHDMISSISPSLHTKLRQFGCFCRSFPHFGCTPSVSQRRCASGHAKGGNGT